MLKHASLLTATALVALIALPAASQAGGCRELDRVGAGVARVFDDLGRGIHRAGDRLTRAADRTLTAIFHHDRRHVR